MINNWQEVSDYKNNKGHNAICKEFVFSNFTEALDFVNEIGAIAERLNHHPDISFGWGFVNVWLSTHSAKKITDKDYELAKAIDEVNLD